MPKMMMHHTHSLELSDQNMPGRVSIFQNATIMREIHLYVECHVPATKIHELIMDKYGLKVGFDEVYRAALSFGSGPCFFER